MNEFYYLKVKEKEEEGPGAASLSPGASTGSHSPVEQKVPSGGC